MRPLRDILLCMILSIAVMTTGEGVSFMRCIHSGKTTILLGGNYGCDNTSGADTHGCMSITHIQLSPAMTAQGPIVLNHFLASLMLPAAMMSDCIESLSGMTLARLITMVGHMCHDGPPPLDVIHFLHTLLI